jgi:hypothetical protein
MGQTEASSEDVLAAKTLLQKNFKARGCFKDNKNIFVLRYDQALIVFLKKSVSG